MITSAKAWRVLIIEDEVLVAMLIEDMLLELGFELAGSAASLAEALAAVERGGFDLAVLDVNLRGSSSYEVADRLRTAAIPFLFATGYGAAGLDAAYREVPILPKPFQRRELAAALGDLVRGSGGEGRARGGLGG